MTGHEQQQIDELKDDVRGLSRQLNDFIPEARERGAEIVGLINTANATAQGDRNRLESEVRLNKLACDDNHDRATQASTANHAVAMKRIDTLKASRTLWFSAAIAAFAGFVASIAGGWSENFFGK